MEDTHLLDGERIPKTEYSYANGFLSKLFPKKQQPTKKFVSVNNSTIVIDKTNILYKTIFNSIYNMYTQKGSNATLASSAAQAGADAAYIAISEKGFN